MTRVECEQALEALPTSGCTLVVESGHLLHGIVEQVLSNQDESGEVLLRIGGKEIFIPIADIDAVAPLNLERQDASSDPTELADVSAALITTTHNRARKLGYSIQENIGISAGESGYGAYKAERIQPTEAPSFPTRLVYFEHNYIDERLSDRNSRFQRLKHDLDFKLKLSLLGTGFEIGYDPKQSDNGFDNDLLTAYLDSPDKRSIETLEEAYGERPENGAEPVVTGYLEVIEFSDGPLRQQNIGADKERIGALIKADQGSPSTERCLVAWFKPESISVQEDRIEALDAVDSAIRMRGSVWEREREVFDGSETLFPKHNMLVRAGAFIQS